jgi:hypothetical protein
MGSASSRAGNAAARGAPGAAQLTSISASNATARVPGVESVERQKGQLMQRCQHIRRGFVNVTARPLCSAGVSRDVAE